MPPEERREQLLDAALEVLGRDGYSGVTIDAIAREADVTRPVVYGVFDGLGALLYALLDRTEARALRQLMSALGGDGSPVAGLRPGVDPGPAIVATVRTLTEAVRADPLTWRPILLAPEGTPAAVQERIGRDREVVRGQVQSLIELGIAARPDMIDVDSELASHALIGIAETFGRLIVADPERFDSDRLSRAVGRMVAALGI